MPFTPLPPDASFATRITEDSPSKTEWVPLLAHTCLFSADVFGDVMLNLIHNPNLNSSYLFRADTHYDDIGPSDTLEDNNTTPPDNIRNISIEGYERQRTIVRELIPRNPQLDKSLLQTCHLFRGARKLDADAKDSENQKADEERNLVIYISHIDEASSMPWYHPKVRGIGFLYTCGAPGQISIHFAPFPSSPPPDSEPRLLRTAHHLLSTLHKHGNGALAGYTKRVQHDALIPQKRFQDTYSRLKASHAKRLIGSWVEATDPSKHVFEDLGIAAFLLELWKDMYPQGKAFPGFVDIGCGNGVLVDILLREGYTGSGFDARKRKTWATFSEDVQGQLQQLVLVPQILMAAPASSEDSVGVHNGIFPSGTFIISNHADELTGWTPLLASLSRSPFLAIPCCSHNLSGAKFRAPRTKPASGTAPKAGAGQGSTYAALVDWVERLGVDVGWEVEHEMLRIPSTRNAALVARRKSRMGMSIQEILDREGGADGWVERAMALAGKCGGSH
ncbi:MAG: tRNA(Ser) Um(44) 2'-O-methyltransferase [Trizodia sp. TS-e1964]|nr:MAG: tRNA(Ser) Um(44) 2'-O-methyltransferase [Trizodia sp. TS-e1964]